MIYTDEHGDEWETLPETGEGTYLKIRPVKQEPKYEVILADPYMGMGEVRVEFPYPGKAQAQLIKEAVAALMANLTYGVTAGDDLFLQEKVDIARQSMRDEDELDASGPGDVIPKGI